MERIMFRKLKAEEVTCNKQVTHEGVNLLLYKRGMVDAQILDEAFGSYGWQKEVSSDGKRCAISIRDPESGEWIKKEDVGGIDLGNSIKCVANDAMRRAGFAWGIGKELFTAPNIFIPGNLLSGFDGNSGKCTNRFSVNSLSYNGDRIEEVGISVSGGAEPLYLMFGPYGIQMKKEQAKAPVGSEKETPSVGFRDDEIILIGNCRRKKYGEVKNSAVFASMKKWAKTANATYPEPEKNEQLRKLKAM